MASDTCALGCVANDSSDSSEDSSVSNQPRVKPNLCICPICADVIKDATARRDGQDAIFCEGSCKSWLHRGCAGLNRDKFIAASNSPVPFFCPCCRLDKHDSEIDFLKASIRSLSDELLAVKSSLDASPLLTRSYASVAIDAKEASKQNYLGPVTPPAITHKPSSTSKIDNDRKCNLILFGIDECDSGTPRLNRTQHDFKQVTSALSHLNSDVTSNSVVDCHRLGKFDSLSLRPRPILAKLTRRIDVLSVLSQRKELRGKISIRADLSKQERLTERLLLGERWCLLQAGTNRRDIKIRQNSLWVSGKLHAGVLNGALELSSPGTSSILAAKSPLASSHPIPPASVSTSGSSVSNLSD